MANKQGLIDYLSKVGKTNKESWLELALMFEFRDGELARKAWLKHRKTEPITEVHIPKSNPPIFTKPVTTGHIHIKDPFLYTTGTFTTIPNREDTLQTIRDTMSKNPIEDLLTFWKDIKSTDTNFLLELALFDVHIGKLATTEECGEDYNVEIATKRYTDAITDLLSRVNLKNIDRILLPLGNDFVHIDSKKNTTTAGTPQDVDGRYPTIAKRAKTLLIDTINKLATIAPIDVVIIHGNHDTQTMFAIGEILDAYYHNDSRVSIDNTCTQRKYYVYHNTAIQFTHGNEEKHSDLPLLFATEKPALWGITKHRYCQLGHYHKAKRTVHVSVDSMNGVEVQIIPSLSGADAWHTSKGYISNKQAKAFLFDKDNGLITEMTYNA